MANTKFRIASVKVGTREVTKLYFEEGETPPDVVMLKNTPYLPNEDHTEYQPPQNVWVGTDKGYDKYGRRD